MQEETTFVFTDYFKETHRWRSEAGWGTTDKVAAGATGARVKVSTYGIIGTLRLKVATGSSIVRLFVTERLGSR